MTASQIIFEIEALPPEQQAEVVRFAFRLEASRRLTGSELTALAQRLVATTDPVESASLRAELERGFYGAKANA